MIPLKESLVGALLAAAVPLSAAAECPRAPALTLLVAPLERSAAQLEAGKPLLVVAVGSSSTAGTGASTPADTYPSRLEAELKQRRPDAEIRVLNRGKGGEDAPEELARLERDVVASHPDLVIWQVGTNAVLRRDDLSADGEVLRRGVAVLKQGGIDVVLMDMQYAPRVIDRPSYAIMQDIIAETADRAGIGLFRRFELMRYWQRTAYPETPWVAADGLHMNDAGYHCLAANLADALTANWSALAKSKPRGAAAPDAVAGLTPFYP
jgi:lysophospholipase L1-like esterase